MALEQRAGDDNDGTEAIKFPFGNGLIHGQEDICRFCDFVIPVKRALLPSAPACTEFDRLKMQHQVPSEPNLTIRNLQSGDLPDVDCDSLTIDGVRISHV